MMRYDEGIFFRWKPQIPGILPTFQGGWLSAAQILAPVEIWAAHNGSRKQWKNSESRHRGKFFKHLSDLVVLTCSQLPSEWWRSLGSESALNDSESLMKRRKWPHKLGNVLFRAWWIPLKRSENPAHWSHESCCQWKAWQRGIHQCLHLGKPEDPTSGSRNHPASTVSSTASSVDAVD